MKSGDMQKTFYKVADFVSWSRSRTLVLSPEFQRRSVWKPDTKSYLIDTIARGLPIPPIFLRDTGIDPQTYEPKREVVDGQQRLRTVLGFIDPDFISDYNPAKDRFFVKRVHNEELAGKTFRELDTESQRSILEYQFNVNIFSSYVDDREVIQIFRRMNSTNYTVNAQELRNANFFGEFKTSVYQLAAEQLHRWREWKIFTEDDISRMKEVELTNELIILMLRSHVTRNTKDQVDKVYEQYDEIFTQREQVEERFRVVMDAIADRLPRSVIALSRYKRSLLYGLFAYFYDAFYGLEVDLEEHVLPKPIQPDQIAHLRLAIERIEQGNAADRVLIAIKKSTTDAASRRALFEYLRG